MVEIHGTHKISNALHPLLKSVHFCNSTIGYAIGSDGTSCWKQLMASKSRSLE